MERGGGEGKERNEKGEIGGVALASREKFMWAPMLQFLSTKLVYRWKASHQNG